VLPSDHPDNRSRRSEGSGVITPYQDFAQEWTGPSTRPPATVNGVLFFKSAYKGVPKRCSASTVNSPAENLVFTAGRCVHLGYGGDSGWHTNVVFVPGYREGSKPYGEWAAFQPWSINAWIDSRNVGYDVGAVVFYPKSGERLVDVVGGNGILFDYPAEQYTYTFGYASTIGERPTSLHYCSGTPVWNGIFDPKRMSLPCDFPGLFFGRESHVGGPWVMRFDGELGYLHSVTSDDARIGDRYWFTGIQFENAEENLYNAVRVRYTDDLP
jgi:hypothetical protein